MGYEIIMSDEVMARKQFCHLGAEHLLHQAAIWYNMWVSHNNPSKLPQGLGVQAIAAHQTLACNSPPCTQENFPIK